MHRRRIPIRGWAAVPAALVVLVLGLAPVTASSVAPLVVATGPSPYAGCTVGAGTGTVFVNAEVEPQASINPVNASNVVAAWQQDRWSNGGAHGLVAGYSFDGGASWGQTPLPFSSCAPGGLPYERASDPWVSFGQDGTLYTNAIAFDVTTTRNAVAAATSTDGGKTWGNLAVLVAYETNGSQFATDKNSITADPVHAGVAYSVWDTLIAPTDQPDDNPHAAYAAAYSGPTYFSKTTDHGKTWSAPQQIVSTGQRQQTIGNVILVDPRDGTLYDFFDWIRPPNAASLNPPPKTTNYNAAFVKSTDGGATWSKPQVIARMETVYVSDPNTGAAIRTGDIIPEQAIDPVSGALYVVWQDSRFNGGRYDEVAISSSTDGGKTWSAPARVSTPTGRPAFTPTVQVNANGVVAVTYYDFRNLQAGNVTTLPTDYWIKTSGDGGRTFGPDTHLAGPFDMLTAPNARGYFVGDYEGLAASGSVFRPVFVQTSSGNTANRTDVFTTSVAP